MSLLSALERAFRTTILLDGRAAPCGTVKHVAAKATGMHVGVEADQNAIHLVAARAERSFSIALERLGRLVEVAVLHKPGPQIEVLSGLFQFALQLEALLLRLRQLEFEISQIVGEFGDGEKKLRMVDAFGNFFDGLQGIESVGRGCGGGGEGCEIKHNAYSFASALIKHAEFLELDAHAFNERGDLVNHESYIDLAIKIARDEWERQAGIVIQTSNSCRRDGVDRWRS